jgi:hypothetical protein
MTIWAHLVSRTEARGASTLRASTRDRRSATGVEPQVDCAMVPHTGETFAVRVPACVGMEGISEAGVNLNSGIRHHAQRDTRHRLVKRRDAEQLVSEGAVRGRRTAGLIPNAGG